MESPKSNYSDSYYKRIGHYSAERVAPFNKANLEYPQARETERQQLIELIDAKAGKPVN